MRAINAPRPETGRHDSRQIRISRRPPHPAPAAATVPLLLIADLDRFRMTPDPQRPALVLGYGNLPDAAVARAVSVLAETIATAATRPA